MKKLRNSQDLVKAVISIARKFVSELKSICEDASLSGNALREKLRKKLKDFESILDFLEFTRKLVKKSKKV